MVFVLDSVVAAIADCSTAIAAFGAALAAVWTLIKAYRFVRDAV